MVRYFCYILSFTNTCFQNFQAIQYGMVSLDWINLGQKKMMPLYQVQQSPLLKSLSINQSMVLTTTDRFYLINYFVISVKRYQNVKWKLKKAVNVSDYIIAFLHNIKATEQLEKLKQNSLNSITKQFIFLLINR